MNVQDIIRRPLITEKSTGMREESNTIAFEVHPKASKDQVRKAIEELFTVKSRKCASSSARKVKRMGRYSGKRRDWRKAYVRLKEGEKAPEFFEGV